MEIVAALIGVVVCVVAVVAALKLRPSKSGGRTATSGRPPVRDPFAIGDPWRRHVAAAQSAQKRFAAIVGTMKEGPLRTRMAEIGRQVDEGVEECWQIAKHGDQLDDTIRSLDGTGLRARFDRAADDATRTSVQSQLDSLERIRSARQQTEQRLHTLQTRLGELVAQAAEVSIVSDTTAELGAAVGDVVVQLEALLQAVDEVNTTGRSRGFETGGPGTATPTT
ncbi:unannotated protein [freshwater metagenome]|uniref:Unannotated protein n=1 Tax=freshwater metagenome TaxID=449393 RepID=A0A6J6DUS5_9ZZZZ